MDSGSRTDDKYELEGTDYTYSVSADGVVELDVPFNDGIIYLSVDKLEELINAADEHALP